MVYQGSKSRIAKYIVPIIQRYIDFYNIRNYYEPFVGGANVIDKVACAGRTGFDCNEYLIKLLRYVQTDTLISIVPEECSFEHYAEVRKSYKNKDGEFSDEYIALIGYCASYGGRFFDGGYGRNRAGRGSLYAERLKNLRNQAPKLQGILFESCDYTEIDPYAFRGSLFYLDSPYRGTKHYLGQSLDYEYFYSWSRALSENNIVLVSEYNMPDDFRCIWSKDVNVLQKSDRTATDKAVEKLFIQTTSEYPPISKRTK